MHDELQPFRQPLVTATGILLAFLLNIAGSWVGKAFSSTRVAEYLLAMSICIPIPLYIIVLYRILKLDYPRESYLKYYKKTLAIFISAVFISFLSMMAILIESAAMRI
jgi:hypothetical protein